MLFNPLAKHSFLHPPPPFFPSHSFQAKVLIKIQLVISTASIIVFVCCLHSKLQCNLYYVSVISDIAGQSSTTKDCTYCNLPSLPWPLATHICYSMSARLTSSITDKQNFWINAAMFVV